MEVFKNTLWMGHIIMDLDRIIQLLVKRPFNGSGQLMSKREHTTHVEVPELLNLLFSNSPIGDVTASYFACNNPGTTVVMINASVDNTQLTGRLAQQYFRRILPSNGDLPSARPYKGWSG